MAEIIFKATKKVARYCPDYRQIEKRGDVELELDGNADDVISLQVDSLTDKIIIDCDKKTGEFHLKFKLK